MDAISAGVGIKNSCASQTSGTGLLPWSPNPCILKESKEHHFTPLMRKIEQQMIAAVQNNINWSSANTTVHFNEETGESVVRLHGNKIAVVSDNDMTIFDGGYQSVTTKSRINALCDAFCITGEGVFQKDFAWYVRHCVGAINGKSVFKNVSFTNGYVFA